MTFGRHKGQRISEVPEDYKDWVINKEGANGALLELQQYLKTNETQRRVWAANPMSGRVELKYTREYDKEPAPGPGAFMAIASIPRQVAEDALCLAVELYGLPPEVERDFESTCYCEGSKLARCILAQRRLGDDEWGCEHDLEDEKRQIEKASMKSTHHTLDHSTGRRAECYTSPREAAEWDWPCPFSGPSYHEGSPSQRMLQLVSEGEEGDSAGGFCGLEHYERHPFCIVNEVPALFMSKLTLDQWKHVRGVGQNRNPSAEECYQAVKDYLESRKPSGNLKEQGGVGSTDSSGVASIGSKRKREPSVLKRRFRGLILPLQLRVNPNP